MLPTTELGAALRINFRKSEHSISVQRLHYSAIGTTNDVPDMGIREVFVKLSLSPIEKRRHSHTFDFVFRCGSILDIQFPHRSIQTDDINLYANDIYTRAHTQTADERKNENEIKCSTVVL